MSFPRTEHAALPAAAPLPARLRVKTWAKILSGLGAGLLGHVEALSRQGLGLLHNQPLPLGGVCELYFMLTVAGREHILHARCRVDSCSPAEGGYGLMLSFVDCLSDAPASLLLIDAFLAQAAAGGQHAEVAA
ncbi:hypothetical protein [Chitinimonas taiwanensis]|uniref:PilZ domain-containing protein n=1 Tax=Chitinimonas taiwanensis DSM 18899 TaxID=1121279 RepID=A0A1K2HL76_9NEIS|nr:hypothetical protein [Chitinimonas taiwanensis]SFZ76994.1 hypothetical protein SAMN02745887_02184 [Chitinimonas taiwanensis DSM 18899]